jgi:hypothetical protein
MEDNSELIRFDSDIQRGIDNTIKQSYQESFEDSFFLEKDSIVLISETKNELLEVLININ